MREYTDLGWLTDGPKGWLTALKVEGNHTLGRSFAQWVADWAGTGLTRLDLGTRFIDHNTGYLRRILVDMWGADLTVVEREFTLVGINPALDQFTDLAAAMKATAYDAAVAAGKALATR